MAFCETAQRDCRYLDIVEAYKRVTVTDQASQDEGRARYAAQITDGIELITEAPEICDELHCQIVAGMLKSTFTNTAHIETLERHLTEE